MHGYFMSLQLYDTARLIANPFAYAEHREKVIREKMDRLAETRIRTKNAPGVKVNKALAEKILKDDEKARKKEERRKRKKTEIDGEHDAATAAGRDADAEPKDLGRSQPKSGLFSDTRFSRLFEDPDFEVDTNSREYALMNPSTVAQRGKERDWSWVIATPACVTVATS